MGVMKTSECQPQTCPATIKVSLIARLGAMVLIMLTINADDDCVFDDAGDNDDSLWSSEADTQNTAQRKGPRQTPHHTEII